MPSPEEFANAVAVLERHAKLGPSLRSGRLRPYEPMPPLVLDDAAGGDWSACSRSGSYRDEASRATRSSAST